MGERCRSRIRPVRCPDSGAVLGWSVRAACRASNVFDGRDRALRVAGTHYVMCRAASGTRS